MTWHFPQSGTTGLNLFVGDDVFVAQQVFLNALIQSTSGGHEVIVAGTVANEGQAIDLGESDLKDSSSVTVEASGQVRSFDYFTVELQGEGQQLLNHGLIAQNGPEGLGYVAAYFKCTTVAPAVGSRFVNTGIVDAVGFGVFHEDSTDTFTLDNTGTIRGGRGSFISSGTSKDEIINSGKMIGDITLGGGEDLYDGRLGTIAGDVFGEVGNDRLYAGAGNDRLFGQEDNDTLMGGAGADYLSGGTGVDRASYASATKAVIISLANPAINSGDAKGDTFNSIENLSGSNYNDVLNGNSGANAINGGAGNDIIKGYAGNDTLTGYSGADTFVFNTALNGATNADTITDFNRVDDTIQVDNAFFIGLVTGPLAASAFKDIAVAANDASDRILYNSDTGNLYFDRDGSGTAFSAVKFAFLTGTPTLTAADFVVI